MPEEKKNVVEAAIDKTKELAKDVKESAVDAYDKLVGNRAEDKAARSMKQTADDCANKVSEARDKASKKMHDAAKAVGGH